MALVVACDSKEPAEEEVTEETEPETEPETEETEPDETEPVDADGDGFDEESDCDDSDAAIHPDAAEVCDGVDNNCDGTIDTDATDLSTFYTDADGDGFGDEKSIQEACDQPSGTATVAGDCDDSNAEVHPDATESPFNDIDDDCDGTILASGAVTATADCGLNNHIVYSDDSTYLRIVGVYEPGTEDGDPIAVNIETEEPVTLVLSSYDEVAWEVTEAVSGTIQEILVSGYYTSTVSAPSTAAVSEYFGSRRFSSSAYHWDDEDARELVTAAELETGLQLASFHGCYNPTTVTIADADTLPSYPEYPQCDDKVVSSGPSAGPDTSILSSLSACSSIITESMYCMGASSGAVRLVGMDTGDTCTVTNASASGYSMTWLDEYLYFCDSGYDMLQRVDLTSGFIEKSYVYCGSVVSWNGALIANPDFSNGVPSSTPVYDAWEDAQCLGPSQLLSGYGDSTARQTGFGNTLYTAWHSTDTIETFDFATFTSTGDIELQDYDGWVYGLSVPAADTLVLNARGSDLHVIDTGTGETVDSVELSTTLYGMVCIEN